MTKVRAEKSYSKEIRLHKTPSEAHLSTIRLFFYEKREIEVEKRGQ